MKQAGKLTFGGRVLCVGLCQSKFFLFLGILARLLRLFGDREGCDGEG